MTYLASWLMSLLHRDEEGQGLAEYALILALIAIIAIAALILLGGSISAILQVIGECLDNPTACAA
jgi:pilus assembly protein Flp/PilA